MSSTDANSSREARRRRIVDRGTDRLALITGRIQSLPDASPQSPDTGHPIPPATSDGNVKVEELTVSQTDFTHVEPQSSKILTDAITEAHVSYPKPRTQSSENISFGSSENVGFESSERPQSSLGHSVSRTSQISQPQTRKHKLPFTPKQISSAVTETESLRNFCSLVIACLVVLSYAGFPILRIGLFKKVIFFRPLILLLLTNITIVAAPLLGNQQRGTASCTRESDEGSAEGPGMYEQLGDALEIGLLVQKVFGALFMDCSIYSVIVICGLSLFQ